MNEPSLLTKSSVIYASGHFLIDFSCALIMLSLDAGPWYFVLYNFLAFAVQMPLGLLADIGGNNRRFALIGVFLVLLGFLPCPALLRVLFIGLGNACYHVGGGREALLKKEGLIGLGFFVSPGAIGILLGTLLTDHPVAHSAAGILLLLWGFLIYSLCIGQSQIIPKGRMRVQIPIIMLIVVLLRSLVGMCLETPWKLGAYVIFGSVAAALGKALGGVFSDWFGPKRTGVLSLVAAAGLFLFPDNGVAGVLSILLFNMTMPITLRYAADACPGYEGFSFGLLTFGLFLGYLPSAFGMTLSPVLGAGLSLVSAGLLMGTPEDDHG